MKHNLSRKLAIITILALSVVSHRGPAIGATVEQVLKLPSGHSYRSLGVVRMHFSESGPALMLSYVSNAKDAKDEATIRKEIDEIWPEFRKQVEKEGLSAAIVSANSPPSTSFGFSKGWKYNVVYSQDSNGQWVQLEKH
jgi:hypothetical protein